MSGSGSGSATPSFADVQSVFKRRYQQSLDRTVVYPAARWGGFALAVALYTLRVYYLNGWYIVTYGLAIYLLNLFIGFISPQIDPDADQGAGPLLPMKLATEGEFRPFTRKLPEFQFWHRASRALVIAFLLTFFSLFNIPVFFPILVVYFFLLFGLTMKKQIAHMIKHRYVPISWGKKKFMGKGKKKGDDPVAANGPGTHSHGEPRFTGANLR